MQRYFVENEQIKNGRVLLEGGDFHHMKHVMRMKPGEKVLVNDRNGTAYQGVVESFSETSATVIIQSRIMATPTLNVTIAQALIKKDAFELMIEKATEFGAFSIIPTLFSRSIVKIEDEETARKKVVRYQMIAEEAAEQSHRSIVPKIGFPARLSDLPFADYDRIWVCYEASKPEETLKRAVVEASPEDRILILVGPEGGIESAELVFLKTKGARIIDLGVRILRSETASLYVLSVLSYLWGR